jgi:hypothetical protein
MESDRSDIWLSQTDVPDAKSAIFIGEINDEIIKNEMHNFPNGILIISLLNISDLLNKYQNLFFEKANQNISDLKESVEKFLRLDQDNSPIVKCSHLTNSDEAKKYLDALDLVIGVIDSTLRVRKTRKETGFLRQSHVIKNLANYLNNRIPDEWKNLASGSIAVVVGAGPSLDCTLNLLKSLDKPLIISTDSGLRSLQKLGIKPNFVLSIDPEKTFESCCDAGFTKGTLILSTQSNPSWSDNWNNSVRFISGRVISEDWLSEKGVGKTSVLAENNVGLSAISFANFLSPSLIILVGMDLSGGGQGEIRYAKITGREQIVTNASVKHEIPGNFSETVLTPFLSDWQETSQTCQKISSIRPIINLNDRGAKLEGTNIIHPDDFNNIKDTLNENFSPFPIQPLDLNLSRSINQFGKTQLAIKLTRICDLVWKTIHNRNKSNPSIDLKTLLSDKEIASVLGDYTFSVFSILLSKKKIEHQTIELAYSQLEQLIWQLEDSILDMNPSEDFITAFLLGKVN